MLIRRVIGAVAAALPFFISGAFAQEPYLVKDIPDPNGEALPAHLFDYHGVLLYSGEDENGDKELWRSDGSSLGTYRVKDINPGDSSDPQNFALFQDIVYFSAESDDGRELWRTDGTEAGTFEIENINTAGSSDPEDFEALDDLLLFTAVDASGDRGLWKTDGTTVGTLRVADTNTSGNDIVFGLTRFGDEVIFRAADSLDDRELWKSDGTAGGTMRVKDIRTGASSSPNQFTVFNGAVFFTVANNNNTGALWKTDGTTGNTVEVFEVNNVNELTVVGSTLFFSGTDGQGAELWKSDGTGAGTMRIADITPGGDSSSPHQFTVFDGQLFFSAQSSAGDFELWKSNGTGVGTMQVKDINPTAGAFPQELTPFNGLLYFKATDGGAAVGTELWRSDGTADGTFPVRDLTPGTDGSIIRHLTPSGGRLFFSAKEFNGAGEELYALAGNLPHLANISTRGFVGTGDNVMIAGFIIEGARKSVLVRAIGPGLDAFGVPNTLSDPALGVFSGPTQIASNDNWSEGDQAGEIVDTGFQPGFALEAALILELDPGPYTAIVSGGVGNARVDVIELD